MTVPDNSQTLGKLSVKPEDIQTLDSGNVIPAHATQFQIVTAQADTLIVFQRLVVNYGEGGTPTLKTENLVAISMAHGTAKNLAQLLAQTISDFEEQVKGTVPIVPHPSVKK